MTSALQRADRFRTDLVRRGVLLVPVIWGEGTETKVKKKGFSPRPKAAKGLPSIGVRFDITMHLHEPFSFIQSFCFFGETKSNHRILLGRF